MVMGELTQETELLVIGAGPGGYAAAFRAADLGMEVTMVDLTPKPGGTCLHRGCIPSKTYLHVAQLLHDAQSAQSKGVTFTSPHIDLAGLRQWKDKVVDQLTDGLISLANRRGIQVLCGRAVFEGPNQVRLTGSDISRLTFKHAIIATGSSPVPFTDLDGEKNGRVMTSDQALDLPDIPSSLLVIGGGYVGLELGSVYAALGSRVSVVEQAADLLYGVDQDLIKILKKSLNTLFETVYLNTRVKKLREKKNGVTAWLKGPKAPPLEQNFERVLVAMGRRPATAGLGLDLANVQMDANGFIKVDDTLCTTNPQILAVGDVIGGIMLAHTATKEGKIAAEVISGQPSAFDVRAIPAVVYTDPQIAWCGLTEMKAAAQKIPVTVKRFPWHASGRAVSMGRSEGVTKMIVNPETQRILGVGIVGRGAEELIAEAVLAIEMGALAEDLAYSIHPHPTLSETQGEVAEIFSGSATHILPRKKI